MTTPIVPSITDEQLVELEDYCSLPVFQDETDAPLVMGELRGLIARLRDAEKDAARYRWICDNACDLNFYASGEPVPAAGERRITGKVEIDEAQYPVEDFGSAKPQLDSLIDTAMEQSK